MTRRRPFRILLVLPLIAFGLLQTALVAAASTQTASSIPVVRHTPSVPIELPKQEKDWTVLFYNAADFEGGNPADLFAAGMQTMDNVHVVMLEDTYDGEATVWSVEGSPETPELVALEEWGEIDMGDEAAFTRILAYCDENFPSRRTMVMMYQHGGGWRGACWDDHPGNPEAAITYLTPEEMRQSLDSIGGVDALLFTAPCIMGAIEPVYQLRHSTDLYIGSEPMSGFGIWTNALPDIAACLAASPESTVGVLARSILDAVQRTYDPGKYLSVTPEHAHALIATPSLTAVASTPSLEALASALDAFSLALIDALPMSVEEIRQARNWSQDFLVAEIVDAFQFAKHCQEIPGLEDASATFQQALSQSITYVLVNEAGYPGSHGLSLYFPFQKHKDPFFLRYYHYSTDFREHAAAYRGADLWLLEDTHWDEFLVAFYDRPFDRPHEDE